MIPNVVALEGFLYEKSEVAEDVVVSDISDSEVDSSSKITNIAV